jgi:hypothetical protein
MPIPRSAFYEEEIISHHRSGLTPNASEYTEAALPQALHRKTQAFGSPV